MQVLSRKPGETIVIGDGIRVVVLETASGRARLGIEAPPDVRVDREEIASRRLDGNPDAVLDTRRHSR